MQTPVVGKCEQYLNGAWVDLSARVPWLATPVSISRGLDDSGAPTAGSMTLTMENSDGALTPGATVELKPGGLHVMFMGIKAPFREGESVKAVLTFEKAGDIEVEFKIDAANKGAQDHKHQTQ